MIKKLSALVLLGGALLLPTSCATIVSNSKYPIAINSTPSGADIVITNKEGAEVYRGKTPAKLDLDSGNGYFSKSFYQVKFTKEGYLTKTVPVRASLNPWYFGNIVFGGFIGFLIVDPLTGAMYKIDDEFLDVTLQKDSEKNVSVSNNYQLNVFSINDIPKEWKSHLVKIN